MVTIVTNTTNERPKLLERCKKSVGDALPSGSKHLVIPLHTDFGRGRYDAFMQDEFVALVDDDDTIHPDSISACLEAILVTDSDIAFTNEAAVDIDGSILSIDKSTKNYPTIAANPRHCHHLALVRRSAISEVALELHNKYGTGIEWFIKASAAFNRNKAVFVPFVGYYWTHHLEARSKSKEEQKIFRYRTSEMSGDINKMWNVPRIEVPIYNKYARG